MKVTVDACKIGIEVYDRVGKDKMLSAFAEIFDQTAEVDLSEDLEDEEIVATVEARPSFVDFGDLDLRLASYHDDTIIFEHTDSRCTINVGIFRQNAGRMLRILGCPRAKDGNANN